MTAIGPLLSATIVTSDLDRSMAAYRSGLGLECVAEGQICDQIADLWQAPKMTGARWVILASDSEGIGSLRLIEAPDPPPTIAPLTCLGWAAAELSVSNPESLVAPLERAGFRILGRPRMLGSNEAIQAMQIAGPDGEVLYLADVRAYEGSMSLHRATKPVDRLFIAVLACGDLDHARSFYEDRFGTARVSDREVAVPVLQQSLGLPDSATVRLSSVQLAGNCLVEHDQYPPTALDKERVAGLPCGIAMITVRADIADGRTIDAPPYNGAPVQMLHGGAGEWLELVGAQP